MTRTLSHDDYAGHPARDEDPASGWGWFVALGALFLLFSLLAFGNLLVATVATVYFVGLLMLIGAVGQLVQALRMRRWGSFLLWLLAGILYGIAGMLALTNPVLGAAALTLLLAISLIVSGFFRLWWGATLRGMPGRGWIIASGVVGVIAGIVFYLSWPENTPFLLGIVLAVELGLQGILLIAFGLGIRRVRGAR